jgi:malonyl-CoA O-methyltransferase
MTRVVEAFRLWSATYDTDANPMLSVESRIVAPILPDLRGKRFLDVGCGTGRWLAEALARGAIAFGADLSREMLLEAAGKPGLGGKLTQADFRHAPFPDDWAQIVVCSFTLGYLESLDDGLRELGRITAPDGLVIVTDIHPDGLRKGWTRSFRSAGEVREIEHHVHEIADLAGAGRRAGLELQHVIEGRFDEPEREMFRRAGKEAQFDAALQTAAVLMAVHKKM